MDEITTAHPTSHGEDHPAPTKAQVEPQDLSANPTTRPNKTVSKASTAVASPSLSKTSTLRNENTRLPYKTSSTIHETLPSPTVPKIERWGLFSNIALVAERRNAKEYTRRTKWFITFIVAAGAAIVTTGENIFYPSLQDTSTDLNASLTLTDLSLSLSKISIAFCPLWWSVLSEHSGRRTVYIISFALFILWSILSAVSNSIGMLIAMRVLSASAASSVQSVGAGSVADVWAVEERGTAMGIFYIGQLAVGTLLGPLIGGLLTQEWGWRATQWFLAIYAAIVLILIVLCLPETSARAEIHTSPVSDTMNAIDEKQSLGEEALRQSDLHSRPKVKTFIQLVVEPFHVLTYLRFAALSTTIFIASMAFGTLGLLNVSIQETFSHSPYSLSTIVIGCLYIPIGSGNIFGSVFGGRWSDSIMRRQARKHARYDASGELVYKVEDRVAENAWIAVTSYAGLLVLYGWVVEKGVHWLVPTILGFFIGASSMILFGLVTTMCTELMPKRPASGVALNSMGRNIFACLGFAIAQPLINGIGNGWLFTAAGLAMLVTGLASVMALQRHGSKWREKLEQRA